jgi:hypothetical protein
MKYRHLLLLSVLLPLRAISAHGEDLDPRAAASFQPSPFSGVCEGVALLPNKEYKANKSYWDDVIPRCGVDVQILPDTGFIKALTFRLGQAVNEDSSVDFLRRVGEKTLENIDFNNKVTELWIHCAKGDTKWINDKRASSVKAAGGTGPLADAESAFYDPATCSSRIAQLKDLIKRDGHDYRVNRELMRYTEGAGTAIMNGLTTAGDKLTAGEFELKLPGEKVALTDGEKAEVAKAKKDIDDKARASLEDQKKELLAKVAKLRAEDRHPEFGPGSVLDDPSIPNWFHQWYIETGGGKNPNAVTARPYDQQQFLLERQKQYPGYLRAYAGALGDARILAFLDATDPTDAQIGAAAERLLENGRNQRAKTQKLVDIADGPKSDTKKVDAMADLLQNGSVLRDLLKDDPASCHVAAGLANYGSAKDTRFKAYLGAGLLVTGVGIAYAGPAALAAGGLSAGSAALATSVLNTTIGVVSAAGTVKADYDRFADAKERSLNLVHTNQGTFGAGHALDTVEVIQQAREQLVTDTAVLLASAAASKALSMMIEARSAEGSAGPLMDKLTGDVKNGGLGLSKKEAEQLLVDARAQKPAAVKQLASALNIDENKTNQLIRASGAGLAPRTVAECTVAPTGNCGGLSEKIDAVLAAHAAPPKFDPVLADKLSKTPLSSYYVGQGGDKYVNDFQALLEQRVRSGQLSEEDAKQFGEWLQTTWKFKNTYPELDPSYLEIAKRDGLSLKDFQDLWLSKYKVWGSLPSELKRQLVKLSPSEVMRGLMQIVKSAPGAIKHAPRWILVTASSAIGGFGVNAIKGPIMGLGNALTSSPMQPLTDGLTTLSGLIFGEKLPVTKDVQNMMAWTLKKAKGDGQTKKKAEETAQTLDSVDKYDFSSMPRDEVKRLMDGLEKNYNAIFVTTTNNMPAYTRGGRDVIKDWLINQPRMMASDASTFEQQYSTNKQFLYNLNDKIKSRGTPATDEEKQLMQQAQDDMNTAEDRLAVTVADWRLFMLSFNEVARQDPKIASDPTFKSKQDEMTGFWERYEKRMDMDKYRREMSTKIRDALRDFDPSLPGLENIENPAHGDPKRIPATN